MTTKVKCRPTDYFPDLEPLTDLLRTPPLTTKERLLHIRALGRRINDYIKFMCGPGQLGGSSGEVKEKAVTAFYERLVALEQALARVYEDLRLERNRHPRRTSSIDLPVRWERGAGSGR